MIDACAKEHQRGLNHDGRTERTHQRVTNSQNQHTGEPIDSPPLEPEPSRTTREEVEVTEDDGPAVLGIDKLGEEDVERRPDGVERKVPCVLGEGEEGERDREGEGGKGGLQTSSVSLRDCTRVRKNARRRRCQEQTSSPRAHGKTCAAC